MLNEPKSAAKAVKGRKGRKNVQHELVEAPAVQFTRKQPAKAKAKQPAPTVVTGGKGRKTGMVLARAKLGIATNELAVTRDRHAALLSKGKAEGHRPV